MPTATKHWAHVRTRSFRPSTFAAVVLRCRICPEHQRRMTSQVTFVLEMLSRLDDELTRQSGGANARSASTLAGGLDRMPRSRSPFVLGVFASAGPIASEALRYRSFVK
jgi:hypothetical protein